KILGPLVDFPFHSLRQLAVLPRFTGAAVRPFEGVLVGVESPIRLNHWPCFQAQDLKSLAGKSVSSNTPSSSGAHHNRIIDRLRAHCRSPCYPSNQIRRSNTYGIKP